MNGSLFAADELARRATETDGRKRSDDPTARPLVQVIIDAAIEKVLHCFGKPARVLDVCAGYGCWSSVLRRKWMLSPNASWPLHVTASEIFEPRREHLRKWADEVRIGDWREMLGGDSWDLAMGNPDFPSLVAESGTVDDCMPMVLLQHARAVLLFHQTTSFQRGRLGAEMWARHPPVYTWRVPGSVRFRGMGPGTSSDSRCYQASLWLRCDPPEYTLDRMLPMPPDGLMQWRWQVPPGSEEPSAELPAAPGWAP